MTVDRGNLVAIARREYLARGRTRTFKLTTVVLVVAGLALALAPILLRVAFGEGKQATIEVYYRPDANPTVDVAATLGAILNAPAGGVTAGSGSDSPAFNVITIQDETAARARALAGDTEGVLVVARPTPKGDLTFDFVTKLTQRDRVPQAVRQAAAQVVIQDRLITAGVSIGQQAQLFAPPTYTLTAADPNAKPGANPDDPANGFAVGFALAIVLFMAIVLYGQWIAYSVVEEKSSRVMEVILGAATPFELLTGKVIGVGALAITQYVIVFVPALLAIVFQGQIAAMVLGGTTSPVEVPAALSVPLLLAFGAFFIFGFALYAVLYAGAAALVSRTEDINQIIAPMTLVSTAGYLVAVYSSTGLLDANSPFVIVMSYIPFFSPYLMLSRVGAGLAGPVEVIAALVLLAVTVPLALWVAARFYAAGVLMYGQRPGLRLMFRVLRRGAH